MDPFKTSCPHPSPYTHTPRPLESLCIALGSPRHSLNSTPLRPLGTVLLTWAVLSKSTFPELQFRLKNRFWKFRRWCHVTLQICLVTTWLASTHRSASSGLSQPTRQLPHSEQVQILGSEAILRNSIIAPSVRKSSIRSSYTAPNTLLWKNTRERNR